METELESLAATMKAPGSKEREATWTSWNCPRSATSMKAPTGPEDPASVLQENLPVLVSQRSLEVPLSQSEVRPEPYVAEAEAKPETQKLPETLAPASKWALPSTSSLPVMRRSSEPVRKEEVVVLVPNLE